MQVAGLWRVWAVSWVLCACGASSQPTPAAVPETKTAPAPNASVVVPLAVTPSPKDLFFVGRMKDPSLTLDTLGSWLNLPLPWQDFVLGKAPALAKFTRLDLPVDLALSLEPDSAGMPGVLGVVSIALSEQAGAVESLRSNGKAIDHASADLDYFTLDEIQCAVARANGKAPARLVCSTERKAVDVLAPFVASNLASQNVSDKAIHFEFRAEPIRARYGKRAQLLKTGVPIALRELSLGNARFDAALADATYALADEALLWVDELDLFTIDMDLVPERNEVVSEVALRLRKNKSYLATSITRASKEMGAAPELFWGLPAEANSASFTVKRTVEARDRKVIDTVAELLGGGLEHFGLASGVLTRWIEDFRAVTTSAAVSVVASGAAGDEIKGRTPEETRLINTFGYTLAGVEGDSGAFARFVASTATAFNDKKLRGEVEKRLGEEVPKIPSVRLRKLPTKGGTIQVYDATVNVPAESGENGRKAFTLTPVLALLTLGERTWVSLAMNEKLALAKLKLVTEAGRGATLAENADLARFRTSRVSGAWYTTPAGLLSSVLGSVGDKLKLSREELERAMPNHGKSPLIVETFASAEGPSLTVRLTVPRAALEDASAAVVSGAAQAASSAAASE